jgi:hypothetical protein
VSGPNKDWFQPVSGHLIYVTQQLWTGLRAAENGMQPGPVVRSYCGPVRSSPGLFLVHRTGPQNTILDAEVKARVGLSPSRRVMIPASRSSLGARGTPQVSGDACVSSGKPDPPRPYLSGEYS